LCVELTSQSSQDLGVNPVEAASPVHAAAHEAGVSQDLEMLARCRLADPDPLCELADRQLSIQDQMEHGATTGMGDRFELGLHRDILDHAHISSIADDDCRHEALAMNRNPDVDRWLDEANHPLDATMRRAREIILSADDRVRESIKWKTPTFEYRGNIASFNPSKKLISIMFHRGAEIPGEHPRLEGEGKLVRTMRFSDLDDLGAGRADLEAAIRAWCEWKAAS
jgi:hypothetical protein